jgi:hypothetical protein
LDVSGYNSILLDITISGSATANFKVRNSYTETWRDLGCVKTDDTNPAERFTLWAAIHSVASKATFMSASRSLRPNEVPLRQAPN